MQKYGLKTDEVMEDFVVSARKYRPETFDTVVGQEAITTTLKNSIRNGHLAQSFLFCGPRGVGKTTCARILARTINCMNPGADLEPCGECESCRGFKNNASQNIYELDAASNRSVESMRTLIEQVRIPPQVGKYKVYIIDEVHMLTSEAFNAFLKTLEEPPAYAKFILATTEKNKIIPTILSRCQIFDFKRIHVEDIVGHLRHICEKEGIAGEEEALRVIAQKADGGLRDALSMFDQMVSFSGNSLSYKQVISMLNILDYETYFEMFGYFLQGNPSAALDLFNRILENGFDAQVFVGGLSRHLRTLMLMQDEKTVALVESSPLLQGRYREQTLRCTLAQLLQSLELCNTCDLQYRNSNNKRLLVEILLLQLIRVFAPAALGTRRGEAPVPVQGEAEAQRRYGAEPGAAAAPARTVSGAPSMPVTSVPLVEKTDKPDVQPVVSGAPSPVVRPSELSVQNPTAVPAAAAGVPAQPSLADTPKIAPTPMPSAASARLIGTPASGLTSATSLRNLAHRKQTENGQTAVASPATAPRQPLTQEVFQAVWKPYMQQMERNQARCYALFSRTRPMVKEKDAIVLHVANRFAGEELESMQKPVLDHLRAELNNSDIHFIIEVDESIQPSVMIYTPTEKYEEMQKNNPEIKNFKESLNLDLEL